MGEVISLDERRQARAAARGASIRTAAPTASPVAAIFWFDLSSPDTYFAAERAERMFPSLTWVPVLTGPQSSFDPAARGREAAARAAVGRAMELQMPLVWPDAYPFAGHAAMRVAAFAAERGHAPAFVLAASRLAFCGGFDLDDPEILAEAAAAAALPLDECLRAAGDRSRDVAMHAAGRSLAALGADRLPVVAVGRRLFCGEERLAHASAAVRDPSLLERPTSTARAVPTNEFAG